MKTNRYAVVILAAGFSNRMRRLKPLLQLGGETITDHLTATYLKSGVEAYLVVGHRQDEVRAGIKAQNITIVENPDYPKGMFSSIQAGLSHLRADYQAVLITPVDVPLVRPFTIRRLLGAAEEQPGKILYPVFQQTRGHPPLIPAGIMPDILGFQGEGGLKPVLHAHEKDAINIRVPDRNVLFDVDDAEDYKILLERYRHYDVPAAEELAEILDIYIAPHLRHHGTEVAGVADVIARGLSAAGVKVDQEAIHAAATLHDIAGGRIDGEASGANLLREMGFTGTADIVAELTGLQQGGSDTSLESKVVYLADKFVAGKKPVE